MLPFTIALARVAFEGRRLMDLNGTNSVRIGEFEVWRVGSIPKELMIAENDCDIQCVDVEVLDALALYLSLTERAA